MTATIDSRPLKKRQKKDDEFGDMKPTKRQRRTLSELPLNLCIRGNSSQSDSDVPPSIECRNDSIPSPAVYVHPKNGHPITIKKENGELYELNSGVGDTLDYHYMFNQHCLTRNAMPSLTSDSDVSRVEALIRNARRRERLLRRRHACVPREAKKNATSDITSYRTESIRYTLRVPSTSYNHPHEVFPRGEEAQDKGSETEHSEDNYEDIVVNASSNVNDSSAAEESSFHDGPPDGFIPDRIVCRHCEEEKLKSVVEKLKSVAPKHLQSQADDSGLPRYQRTVVNVITIEPQNEATQIWRPW